MKENVENIKLGMAFIVYSALTWIWFELNNSNSLPLIGHTELVYGWCESSASKMGLLFDLIYFALSVAVCIVVTDIILNKVPLIGFNDEATGVSGLVYFVVLLYEFHVLEFRLKLIGLAIGLFIFYFIGMVLGEKILEILRPLLGIIDLTDNLSDINKEK